jgi:hypothetical protein
VNLDYDPLKDVEEEEEEEVDSEGFVEVKRQVNKKRFNKQGLSFKVSKKSAQEDEDKLLKKEEKGDFYCQKKAEQPFNANIEFPTYLQ